MHVNYEFESLITCNQLVGIVKPKQKELNLQKIIKSLNLTEEFIEQIPIFYGYYLPEPHVLEPCTRQVYNVNVYSEDFISKYIDFLNLYNLSTRIDILTTLSDEFFQKHISKLDEIVVRKHAKDRDFCFYKRFTDMSGGIFNNHKLDIQNLIDPIQERECLLDLDTDGTVLVHGVRISTDDPETIYNAISKDLRLGVRNLHNFFDSITCLNAILTLYNSDSYNFALWGMISMFPMSIRFAYKYRYHLDWLLVSCSASRSDMFLQFFKDWLHWNVIEFNDLKFLDRYKNYCRGTGSFYIGILNRKLVFEKNEKGILQAKIGRETSSISKGYDEKLYSKVRNNLNTEIEYYKTKRYSFDYIFSNDGITRFLEKISVPKLLLIDTKRQIGEDGNIETLLKILISNAKYQRYPWGIDIRSEWSECYTYNSLLKMVGDRMNFMSLCSIELPVKFIEFLFEKYRHKDKQNCLNTLLFRTQKLSKLKNTDRGLYKFCLDISKKDVNHNNTFKEIKE